MSSPQDYEDFRFLLPQGVGIATEDVEKYRPGGFHPVHLGDRYGDGGRYKVVHKLGSGGFATVWLAQDEYEKKWVALKIVSADHSTSVSDKSVLSRSAISSLLASGALGFISEQQFTFKGPNGRHLCLVLPVLGPSASDLSWGFTSRLRPWLARRVGYEATKAVADLHSQGLCHGDVTTANILFGLSDLNHLTETDIYDLFGPPIMGELETESGEIPGPEAPRYIVKTLDFLSSPRNLVTHDIKLVDFDQCFPASSPPTRKLGTPIEFLAPEVAVGLPASPASDIWALGCCLFRLRSGEGPFESPFEVNCPANLISYIVPTLGDIPNDWQQILWDEDGNPTKDPSKGEPLWKREDERSLKNLIHQIWDEPEGRIVQTSMARLDGRIVQASVARPLDEENNPFPPCFSDMVWKPTAVKVDNDYIVGYDSESLVDLMPKIPKHEADLLYDLLSKIFVYDPERRPTAREMLNHPWFHMDGDGTCA